ncbi:hypothetical protein CWN11_30095, partial [Klebsiella pneumoniae]
EQVYSHIGRRRMLENGATRQQVADVIGVGVKTMYKYFPISTIGRGV